MANEIQRTFAVVFCTVAAQTKLYTFGKKSIKKYTVVRYKTIARVRMRSNMAGLTLKKKRKVL